MKLRTFAGKTMAEALGQVKRHLGKDAVILSTRTYTKGGVFGLGGRPCVEVTAVRDLADLPASMRKGRFGDRPAPAPRSTAVLERSSVPSVGRSSLPAVAVAPPSGVDALFSEIGSLKTMVTKLVHETRRAQTAPTVPGALYDTYVKLVSCEVGDKLAEQLIDRVRAEVPDHQLHDQRLVREKLASALRGMVPTAGPICLSASGGPTVTALVGPTGVGKTTTVAKLAASFCLRENKRVGLITIDTYRIAAVEQLRTYAQIIDVPLEIVVSPAQLREAVARMSDRDVILIDTAGRSQRDAIKIRELRSFFDAVRPHETHLVLSSTCGESVLNDAVARFGEVGVDRVIFTKLDEAIGFGVILGCLEKANAKLSYLTTGQDVPDDIEVGEAGRLVDLILGAAGPGGATGDVDRGCAAPTGVT